MRVTGVVHVVGLEIPVAHAGSTVRIEPMPYRLENRGGAEERRAGAMLTINAATSWRHGKRACAKVGELVLASIDLQARLLTRPSIDVRIGGKQCEETIELATVSPHELLESFASLDIPAHSVRLTESGTRQVVALIEGGLAGKMDAVVALHDAFVAIDQVTRSPADAGRVAQLWMGLEATVPRSGGARDKDAATWLMGRDRWQRGFGAAFATTRKAEIGRLIAIRRALAVQAGVEKGLQKRLLGPIGTRWQRLSVALACIYAVRNVVVHGAALPETDAIRAGVIAAEVLTWDIVGATISQRLTGSAAPPIGGYGGLAISR